MSQSLKIKSPDSYSGLLTRVKAVIIEGQKRIEQERVWTYWETGRIIQAHILKHKERAEYGVKVIKRLAKDLNVNSTLLHRCIRFAQKYPQIPIVARGQQFSWSHYRQLITISDDKKRLTLEKAAGRNAWSAEELAARLKDGRPPFKKILTKQPESKQALLIPLRGELFTYQVVKRPTVGGQPELLVDLGFGMFRNIPSWSSLSKGDFVGENFKKKSASAKDLYTYQAVVEKVIDGDTIKVRMNLGYDDSYREVLRLRDIDAPELDTKEGQDAKAFVQSHIKEAQMIIVRSSRSDKYDRYLADIFIPSSGESRAVNGDLYLNNLLLEKGYAKRWME